MKITMAITVTLALLASAQGSVADSTASVTITKAGSQPARPGPATNFTGRVMVEAPFETTAPARVGGATVIFAPGARTFWHTHPLGQTLIVTEGDGRVQNWGGPVEEIAVGDIVWIPPGVKHWHGASPTAGMTHIAIREELDGNSVEWMEAVTDEQFTAD